MYAAVWALSVAVFAVVLFAIGGRGAGLFQNPSWPLALFCLASLLVQLGVGYAALGGKRAAGASDARAKGLFLGMPTLVASSVFSAVTVVCGLVFVNAEVLPVWVGAIVLTVLLAADVACCVGTVAAAGHAAGLDEATMASTAVIAGLRMRAEALAGCADAQAADAVRRVDEALRYADPASNEATRACDEELTRAFDDFERAVRGSGLADASPDVDQLASRVLELVSERASLCKQGKHR